MNRARKARRNPAYVTWVRSLFCVLSSLRECWGRTEPHHAGKKPGVGLKAADDTCIPLCVRHHRELEDKSGFFKGWAKDEMRTWEDAMIAETQAVNRVET